MADELRQQFGVEAKLVPGSHGIFDVLVDGKMVFSKHKTGGFPNPGEVTANIRA